MKMQNHLHIRIAEQGKLYSLEGNHQEALRHYREAMRMVQQQKDSDIFFQHYSQCTMETLERSGAYDEVISFCERYQDFLNGKPESDLIKKHKAYIWQRQAIQHLLKGETEAAKTLFTSAQNAIGRGRQPLTDELLNWVQRGYMVSKNQITRLQEKYNYFVVRDGQVNPALAMKLPESIKPF